MAKSDTESCTDSPNTVDYKNVERVVGNVLDRSNDSTIHSGHFMVSCVHNSKGNPDDSETDEQSGDEGYDFVMASKETSNSYEFGNRSIHTMAIDASLTKLFKCMTLAYSGKLTSPKWKTFKGLKLMLKDKIRLNNIIWREWNMQFIQLKRPIVCQFSCPISDETHSKAEVGYSALISAVVLEGKYWKRRLESVTAEYKKWRTYFKERLTQKPPDIQMKEIVSHEELLEKVARQDAFHFLSQQPQTMGFSQMDHLDEQDDFIMDFTDTLFSSLNQPFVFPNPKELSQLGNADIMQPGLVQLQPNLDDFMDTIEPLQDLVYPWKSSDAKEMQDLMHPSWKSLEYRPFSDLLEQSSKQTTSTMINRLNMPNGNITDFSNLNSQTISSGLPGNSPVQVVPSATLQSDAVNQRFTLTEPIAMDSSSILPGTLHQTGVGSVGTDFSSQSPITENSISFNSSQGITDMSQIGQLLNVSLQQSPQQNQAGHVAAALPANQSIQTLIISNLTTPTNLTNTPIQTINIPHTQPPPLLPSNQAYRPKVPPQQQPQSTVISSTNELLAEVLQQPTYRLNQNQSGGLLARGLSANAADFSKLLGNTHRTRNLSGGLVMPSASSLASTLSGLVTQRSPPAAARPAENADKSTGRRGSTGSQFGVALSPPQLTSSSAQASKKDGEFLVPKGKPTISRNKQRTIAPAPAAGPVKSKPSVAQQNTFLAHLLTKGSYPGAGITVKQETMPSTAMSKSPPLYAPIRPAPINSSPPTSQSLTFALSSATNVSDFQKNMLLAAASQALGTSTVKLLDAMPPMSPASTEPTSPQSPQYQVSSPSFQVPSPTFQVPSPVGSDGGSPIKSFRPKSDSERKIYKEHRRVSHISSEQKRRCNIKNGFDTLHHLVPALSCNPNSKISKAATLQKTADFCKKLKQERSQMQDEADLLRKEIENLNVSINTCQAQLPATGVPVTRQRVDQMREMFDEYVRSKTLHNWKFWIFSIIIRPLFDSYNNMVSTASMDELCRTVLAWLDQHCSLVALRPAVLNSLRHLSTTTSILSDPSKVPEQAAAAVAKQPGQGHSS